MVLPDGFYLLWYSSFCREYRKSRFITKVLNKSYENHNRNGGDYVINSLPYVIAEDISTSYVKSLEKVIREGYIYGLVTVSSIPLLDNLDEEIDVIKSEIINKRYKLLGVNINDKVHSNFKNFYFYMDKKSRKWYGRDKIADRIHTLFEGNYYKALCRRIKNGQIQLEYVRNHLKGGKIKGKIHNTLICTVFDPDRDTCFPGAHCLMSIDFKPEKGRLHLIANWRAQFFNTKAYGNLLSLAMLLRNTCKESRINQSKKSGFLPGKLISIAHKAILEPGVDNEYLLNKLKDS